MKMRKTVLILFVSMIYSLTSVSAGAQDTLSSDIWTLERCIQYAKDNNIQVSLKKITQASAEQDLLLAKAQQYPSLNFSNSNSISFQNATSYNEYNEQGSKTTIQGSASLNSSFTLYNGGQLRNNIKQSNAQYSASGYNVEQSLFDLEISVTQAYLQILYNNESLLLSKDAAELSKAQVDRGEQLFTAGSISKADMAQLKSQYASDKYNVVTAQNTLASSILTLKQLLELGINDEFNLDFPEISDEEVSDEIPYLNDVYNIALSDLPSMKSSELDITASEYALKSAKGAALPSISMGAGVSTGAYSGTGIGFIDQLNNKLNENVSLSISIPIFNKKQVRISVAKAKLQQKSAVLQNETAKKELLSTVESLHNDAVAAVSQFTASEEQLISAKAGYEIVNEQFNAGIKNTVELLTEKNNLITAKSNRLQAKYKALLSEKILNYYMNKEIEL